MDRRMSASGADTGDAVPSSSTRTRASDRNQWYLQQGKKQPDAAQGGTGEFATAEHGVCGRGGGGKEGRKEHLSLEQNQQQSPHDVGACVCTGGCRSGTYCTEPAVAGTSPDSVRSTGEASANSVFPSRTSPSAVHTCRQRQGRQREERGTQATQWGGYTKGVNIRAFRRTRVCIETTRSTNWAWACGGGCRMLCKAGDTRVGRRWTNKHLFSAEDTLPCPPPQHPPLSRGCSTWSAGGASHPGWPAA